jgi:hypothetical protein
MNPAPHSVGAVTNHQSMDRNPCSPRVPGYGRGAWPYRARVYTMIERNTLLWEIWVDFPDLVRIFCVGKITSLISSEKMPERKL